MRPLAVLLTALLLTACAAVLPVVPATQTPFPLVATPTPGASPTAVATPTPDFRARLRLVATGAAEERGLQLPTLPEPRFLSRAELESRYREQAQDEDYLREISVLQDLLEVMEVISPGHDLARMYTSLQGSAVLGFFDPETGELVVVGAPEQFGIVEEMTLAHEYTHALQQAAFDIGKLMSDREGDSEASAGLTALIEGDANLTMYNYIFRRYTQGQVAAASTGDPQTLAAIANAPRFITDGLLFPYREGFAFVSELYAKGGWPAVNAAYARPPRSTQQVMHPDLYRAGKEPRPLSLPDAAGALGQGWTVARQDTFGEFDLRSTLIGPLPTNEAAQAAAGWAGDTVAVLRGPLGQRAVVSLVAWDNDREAFGYFEAYYKWLRVKGYNPQRTALTLSWSPGPTSTVPSNPIPAPSPAPPAAALRVSGTQTLLLYAPDQEALNRLLAAFPAFGVTGTGKESTSASRLY